MEWNTLLLWLAGTSCLINLITAARASPPMKGWMLVCGFLVALAAVLYFVLPAQAGLAVGGLWIGFVLAPALLQRRVMRLTLRHRYSSAAQLAAITRMLHPFDGMWRQSRLLHALDLSERGETDHAIAILHDLRTAPPRVARTAFAHICRLTWEWPQFVEWVRHNGGDRLVSRDLNLLATYLRSLGECGRVDEMLATFDRHRARLDSPMFTTARHTSRLHVLAFCGEPERMFNVLAGPLRMLPETVQQFWLGTAELAAGWTDSGTGRLLTIEDAASPGLRKAIAHRLESPPIIASRVLTPAGREILHRLEQERDQESRYATIRAHGRRPWVTYGLIIANCAMFAAEWAMGGTTNEESLLRLGAFHLDLVNDGEYWRIFTANFLHFGVAHIALNMIALLVLGPFVEFALGAIFYLPIYLVSGVLAIATVWLVQWLRHTPPELMVGASGAIMGLIGATAAILLRGWARERARIAMRRLWVVVLIITLQSVFDQLTPQVSGTAHLAGVIWGFVLTSLVPHRTTRRPPGFDVVHPSHP
jgi:rhomboid protease GluP